MDAEQRNDGDRKVAPNPGANNPVGPRLVEFAKRQNELWRLTFVVLLAVSLAFAWFSWDVIRTANFHMEALPSGLVTLVVLLCAYVWKKTQDIAELKGQVRGLEQKDETLPSDRQLEQLVAMISRSQQGFRDLIDSFDDILLALSLDGEIRAANRRFSDFVGQAFQEIIGLPVTQFLSDESGTSKEALARGLERFVERRIWAGVVQVRLKKTGTVHFFDCVAHGMVRDDQVHGLTILARDLTKLRRSEARFTELFETLQEGIYIITPEDKILEVNPALVRMLGYHSKEELLARRVSEVFVDPEQRATLAREVNRQPEPRRHEITLRRKDGESIVCLNTATAVRDASGRVVRYQGALADITERRAIEKRLHQQQEFARRLVDSFPDLIFVVDTERRYTFVSPKVEEVLGYDQTESIGMVFGEQAHAEDRGTLIGVSDDLLSRKRNFASIEVRLRHKEGEWRRLRCHFSPLFDENGKIEGLVVSGRDITELKRLEEQLIQAEKLAAMGQMLAGVAHELNNPLTAILGVTELVREREGLDDSMKRQLERTLQLHEHSLRRNQVAVDFTPRTDLPSVVGDANQLIQVLLNLITNAEQAIREVR